MAMKVNGECESPTSERAKRNISSLNICPKRLLFRKWKKNT